MFSANKLLNVGIPEIDTDHEELDELAYKIEKSIISNLPIHEIKDLIIRLQSTTQSHFDKEEQILASYDLPRMAEHKNVHKKIVDDLSALSKKMEEEEDNWRDQLFSILGEMTQHVIFYDMDVRGETVSTASKNAVFEAIRQDRFHDALKLWKLSREHDGICDLNICKHQSNELICCAYHLQGHMLSMSLGEPDNDYLQLSRKIGKWIETQDIGDPGVATKRLSIPSSLIIGHPMIDYDHRQLVDIINYISVALENEEYEECSRLIDKFINFAKIHFQREEKIFEETGFPELSSHRDIHNKLIGLMSEFTEMGAELRENELARERLYPELVAFLFDDAVKVDLVFKSYMMKLELVYD